MSIPFPKYSQTCLQTCSGKILKWHRRVILSGDIKDGEVYCSWCSRWTYTSASYLDLFLSIGKDDHFLTFLNNNWWRFQFPYPNLFCSWVAIYILRPPMAFLFHSLPQGWSLLWMYHYKWWFWRRCGFQISFSCRDMPGNVWNHLLGSYMVDTGILSSYMRSRSPECYITFWSITICSSTLHWTDITLPLDLLSNWTLLLSWPF